MIIQMIKIKTVLTNILVIMLIMILKMMLLVYLYHKKKIINIL